MTKNDQILIQKRTGAIFTSDQIPSIYALVRKYMHYQNDTFDRGINFKKALNEFIQFVFRPIRNEIKPKLKSKEEFYPLFFSQAYQQLYRDRQAERKVRTNSL